VKQKNDKSQWFCLLHPLVSGAQEPKTISDRTVSGFDITKDTKAAKDCERNGCKGVPVVLIGGSRWICGFDQKAIEKALA